ncbi:MAG: hypothetical protein P1U74_01425 [Legionellaceae bacterium]|nr:hypothetical protein [Legionellaceae bacterium]
MHNDIESPPKDRMIEMYDDSGMKILIPKSEYKNNVLPNNLKIHWDNPDDLASTIINAFNDGFYIEVEEAAIRLVEIDPVSERSICLYANILLNSKRYVEAEEVLEDYLQSHARHPSVLSNLASAKDYLDNKADALKLLEESLKANPNEASSLYWWQDIKIKKFESEGIPLEQASISALEMAGFKFGGWLVKLLIGTHYANIKDEDLARNYFSEALQGDWDPSALTTVSFELGKNGFQSDAIKLVSPLYDVYKHEIRTGLNLLQAYLELKQVVDGKELLNKIKEIHRPDLREEFARYELEFSKLENPIKKEQAPVIESPVVESPVVESPVIESPVIESPVIEIDYEYIDYPLWCYGWNIKHGFDSSQTGKKIALYQFSCDEKNQKSTISLNTVNTKESLSVAIPLYLLEEIYYGTNASSTVMLPFVNSHGSYIIDNSPPSTKHIMGLSDLGYDAAITGEISSNELKISYWDLLSKTPTNMTFLFSLEKPSGALSKIKSFLFKKAGILFDPDFKKDKRGFSSLDTKHKNDYLLCISQHAAFYNAIKVKKPIDENILIRGLLNITKSNNDIRSQLQTIAVVHLCISSKSMLVNNFKTELLRWLESVPECSKSLTHIASKTAIALTKYCDSLPIA